MARKSPQLAFRGTAPIDPRLNHSRRIEIRVASSGRRVNLRGQLFAVPCQLNPRHLIPDPFIPPSRESELVDSGELQRWYELYRRRSSIVAEASRECSTVGGPFVWVPKVGGQSER